MTLSNIFARIKATTANAETKLQHAEAAILAAESGIAGWIRKAPFFAAGASILVGAVLGFILGKLL